MYLPSYPCVEIYFITKTFLNSKLPLLAIAKEVHCIINVFNVIICIVVLQYNCITGYIDRQYNTGAIIIITTGDSPTYLILYLRLVSFHTPPLYLSPPSIFLLSIHNHTCIYLPLSLCPFFLWPVCLMCPTRMQ